MPIQPPSSPILVDTSSLVAYCKTSYDERLFRELSMSTTNVCNKEVKRQKDQQDSYPGRQACERYLDLLRTHRTPDVTFVEPYRPSVEDQGERSIETVLEAHPDSIDYILLFDFEAIERLEELKAEIGGAALNTKVSLPNFAFELLRRNDRMTDEEYCEATYQMGVEEGWMKRHALRFDEVSSIDCPQFP